MKVLKHRKLPWGKKRKKETKHNALVEDDDRTEVESSHFSEASQRSSVASQRTDSSEKSKTDPGVSDCSKTRSRMFAKYIVSAVQVQFLLVTTAALVSMRILLVVFRDWDNLSLSSFCLVASKTSCTLFAGLRNVLFLLILAGWLLFCATDSIRSAVAFKFFDSGVNIGGLVAAGEPRIRFRYDRGMGRMSIRRTVPKQSEVFLRRGHSNILLGITAAALITTKANGIAAVSSGVSFLAILQDSELVNARNWTSFCLPLSSFSFSVVIWILGVLCKTGEASNFRLLIVVCLKFLGFFGGGILGFILSPWFETLPRKVLVLQKMKDFVIDQYLVYYH